MTYHIKGPRPHRTGLVLLVVGMLTLMGMMGCKSESDTLEGSLGSRYDLTFQTTRARLYASKLAIEYVRDDGQVPVRIVIDREAGLMSGTFQLTEQRHLSGRVGNIKLPPLESGTVNWNLSDVRDGADIRGDFNARLRAGDTSVTLRGTFATNLEIVEGPRGYTFDTGVDGGDTSNEDGTGSDGNDGRDGS